MHTTTCNIWRHNHADKCGEHNQRHDAGLEQFKIISRACHLRNHLFGHIRDVTSPGDGCVKDWQVGTVIRHRWYLRAYLIFGSSLNWWKGGGDVSVHSRVVAPSPQGLLAAF